MLQQLKLGELIKVNGKIAIIVERIQSGDTILHYRVLVDGKMKRVAFHRNTIGHSKFKICQK